MQALNLSFDAKYRENLASLTTAEESEVTKIRER
jgi:hypothetical protein